MRQQHEARWEQWDWDDMVVPGSKAVAARLELVWGEGTEAAHGKMLGGVEVRAKAVQG